MDAMEGIAVAQLSTGGTHTMLLSTAREVFVMGRGDLGRLGLGACDARFDPSNTFVPTERVIGTSKSYSTPQKVEHPSFVTTGIQVEQVIFRSSFSKPQLIRVRFVVVGLIRWRC